MQRVFAIVTTSKQTTQKAETMKTFNHWKTSDIKISTDSAGFMTAEHKWAGLLIESGYYEKRNDCRRDAVEVLKELKINRS